MEILSKSMEIQEHEALFHEIPQERELLLQYITEIIKSDTKVKRNIPNLEMLKKIYSMFSFKRFNSSFTCKQAVDLIIDFLKDFKFITYYLYQISYSKASNFTCQIFGATICVEDQCIIIERINISTIEHIINELKKNGSAVINVSQNYIKEKSTTEETQSKEEIRNFLLVFPEQIINKEFINKTIRAIAGYLIRRYFYPTEYFKNQSFFDFDKETNDRENRSAIKNIFKYKDFHKLVYFQNAFLYKEEQTIFKIDTKEFVEDDFICLRNIYSNREEILNLVLHKKSLYIFAMKKAYSNKSEHEESFCKDKSHRCLMHFYGFLKKEREIIGFIYEFMSNGTLESYVQSNREKVSDMFSMMTIIRIIQGIDYLHSNSLIHRDLKPSNILLDHDFIPYISDFETIRHPIEEDNSDSTITQNIGSDLYVSPEQYRGENVSFPTDIYSFGLIIFFIFNKSHKKTQNTNILKASNIFQEVYEKCTKDDPKDRLTIQEIALNLCEEFFIFLINIFYEREENTKIYQFIYEIINIMKHRSVIFRITMIGLLLYCNNDSEVVFNLGNAYARGIEVEIDYSKARKYFKLSAQQGNSDALYNLGVMYAYGYGVEQNYLKAVKYFELSAKQNNPDALLNLGIIYANGYGVEQDYLKAIGYYELSAKQGNSNALLNLGIIYANSNGVEQDYSKAKKYYELSAKQGNSDALLQLGIIYDNGYGVERDYHKAKKYYELSSEQGNSNALFKLGIMYSSGHGVEQNYFKAIKIFELSAEQGNSNALYNLGIIYDNGYGIEQNYFKAIKYYKLSAEQGNSNALYNLGVIYDNGHEVEQNYHKAKKYYELSAKQGNSDALLSLGNLYATGSGVEQDYSKAKEYYELSAKQGNSNALYNLGIIYANGYEVERDYHKAKKYYELSAKLNNSDALLSLGNLYATGSGVEQNYLKAIEYYELSAKQENSRAFYILGLLYDIGYGVEQDYYKAKEYYELSAKLNNSDALLNLGNLYANSHGVEQDYHKAKEYYELSAKLNNSDALLNLGNLYSNSHGVEQDYSRAKDYYELSAELGSSNALLKLGCLYYSGHGVEINFSKAKEYFELSAKQNNSDALLILGMIYTNVDGVEINYSKAKEYFELSAKQGNSNALLNLGYFYYNGLGVEKNYSKAKEYFELSANKNNPGALYNLGIMYANGNGVEKNYLKVKRYYELSAKQNNSNALLGLGNLYFFGNGVEKNFIKAKEYFELSAKKNNSNALLNLGCLYYHGIGVKQDHTKAKEYFQSASGNEELSSLFLGHIFFESKDIYKAMFYFEKASKYNNSEAIFKIGSIYATGNNEIKPDYTKAKEYYERSAQKNNSDALFNLGILYEKGLDVKQNLPKAIKYYKLSSKECNSDALFKLCKIYMKGKFVKQDYMKSKQCFEYAAFNNNPNGLYFLAHFYLNGDIFKVNLDMAILYLNKSIKIHFPKVSVYNKANKSYIMKNDYNKYYYHSHNELGLIYITEYQDIKKGKEHIKEAAFAEYPFGQNNLGILNEIYFDDQKKAKHFYKRSSKHQFSLAQYNLGHLKEKEGQTVESIKYYRLASENEDSPLIFHNHKHYDKRLEISKMFIICFTNLKLAEYYFAISNFEESRNFFIKSFSKLNINTEYQLKLKANKFDDILTYLKYYILHFPLFNLTNQTNLSSLIKSIINSEGSKNYKQKEKKDTNNSIINNLLNADKQSIDYIKQDKCLENSNINKEEKEDRMESLNDSPVIFENEKVEIDTEDEMIFENLGVLFDFIIKDENMKKTFHEKINEIIKIMESIIYTPPYNILFGRIKIDKQNSTKKEYLYRKDINELFYEGFGIEI